MFLDVIKFMQENGYDPTDESIPHIVEVCNLHGIAVKSLLCTSFANALAQIKFTTEMNKQITDVEVVVYKVLNVSVQSKPKHISRITSIPESMAN